MSIENIYSDSNSDKSKHPKQDLQGHLFLEKETQFMI